MSRATSNGAGAGGGAVVGGTVGALVAGGEVVVLVVVVDDDDDVVVGGTVVDDAPSVLTAGAAVEAALVSCPDPPQAVPAPTTTSNATSTGERGGIGSVAYVAVLKYGAPRTNAHYLAFRGAGAAILITLAACSSSSPKTTATTHAARSTTSVPATTTSTTVSTTTTTSRTTTTSAPPQFTGFTGKIFTVTAADLGSTYHPGCPVGPGSLRRLRMSYWGFDNQPHAGSMVVSAAVAQPVLTAFSALYGAHFPINRMRTLDNFDGDDRASMAADNTSGFNCRYVAGSSPPRWSAHAYGDAIDINTVENPYVSGSLVSPPAGTAYLDRNNRRPGMTGPGTAVNAAFASIGWLWGGRWASPDYQHFSKDGG